MPSGSRHIAWGAVKGLKKVEEAGGGACESCRVQRRGGGTVLHKEVRSMTGGGGEKKKWRVRCRRTKGGEAWRRGSRKVWGAFNSLGAAEGWKNLAEGQ